MNRKTVNNRCGIPYNRRLFIIPDSIGVYPIGIDDEHEIQPRIKMIRVAKFQIGQVVQHRLHSFRGIIFDVDPEFSNTEEWYESIPAEVRPIKEQPFYHLLAENEDSQYVAYVSEQNLQVDETGLPVGHPHVNDLFTRNESGEYIIRPGMTH